MTDEDREPEGPTDPPLLPGRIIGWRRWDINANGNLEAYGLNYTWKTRTLTAECRSDAYEDEDEPNREHGAPDPDCDCGIYAVHEPRSDGGGHVGYAVGWVAAHGRVEVHPDGFRAEHAEILCLVVDDDAPRLVRLVQEDVAERYGVPVLNPTRARDYAATYGAPVPEDLRPERTPRQVSQQSYARGGMFSGHAAPTQPIVSVRGGTFTNTGPGGWRFTNIPSALGVNSLIQRNTIWGAPSGWVEPVRPLLRELVDDFRPRPILITNADLQDAVVRLRGGGVVQNSKLRGVTVDTPKFNPGRVAAALLLAGYGAGVTFDAALRRLLG